MSLKNAQYWIEQLNLTAHPEGGYYRETYRSDLQIPRFGPEAPFSGNRNASTAIYFLLAGMQCSAFHRIRSDELWHFHTGSTIIVHMIDTSGTLTSCRLGAQIEAGDAFQVIVPAGFWFAAEIADKASFGLCSCTVAPGFDFDDFELADANQLAEQYPQHRELIGRMAIG
ncbi:MAG: cupin domain-containing protein [Deltaproteobacteria bacterium]|nr:cupin domain-containing protein [Deltaproteobacteria bacterium]